MKWKQFKKERISLNYTVMLLPHSQKKPIHFKIPVWFFGLFFLGILVLSGTCLYFAGARHQLKQVQQEKAQLEQEWEHLALQKQLADEENESLKQAREIQEQELKELEDRTRDTIKELEELVERENQIRQELGLDQVVNPEEQTTESDSIQTAETESQTTGNIPTFSRTEHTMSFQAIETELGYLQNSLSMVSGQYDHYVNAIEEKKQEAAAAEAAAAAEIARREALRASIVDNALKFVGNPYVYGGNDPYTGVDCSGFTRYILNHTAGVYLNRTAASQSLQGQAVSAEDARPGDLVFYSTSGSIDHVAIYMGDGRVVHASNERVGITTSDMYYRSPAKIVNVLGD